MTRFKKLVAGASFALLVSSPAMTAAQTAPAAPPGEDTRTTEIVKAALARYADALQVQAQSASPRDANAYALTLDDAVKRAMENNLDIAVERLNPQTFDLTIAGLLANYHPIATSRFGRNDNVRPPSSLLNPGSPNISSLTYNAGIAQDLLWGGGTVSLSFNNNRQDSSDPLANFNPQYNTSYSLQYTQPLLRNFRIDGTRQQIENTKINRDISEVQLKGRIISTLASVRSAYWDYVYAVQAVDVARQSLALAQKLLEDNKVRVEVGTMAPLDIVQAEAEAATRRQTLTQAEATLRTSELALKRLIVGGTNDPLWVRALKPVDQPEFEPEDVDLEAAVRKALADRTDLVQSRRNLDSNDVTLKSLRDQTLPAVDLVTTYGASGLGGIQYTFSGSGFDRQRTGVAVAGGYSNALNTLWGRDYPNWNMFLNVTYPLGGSQAQAQLARARLQRSQTQAQLRALELQVASEVTNAALQVENSIRSVEASRAARELSQKLVDAEQSRFEVGMSTNYQVVQAQRDLRDAQNAELRALLNYRKSLVELDRVQQTGSGGGGGGAAAAAGGGGGAGNTAAAATGGGAANTGGAGGFGGGNFGGGGGNR